jgi:hypothetical protein
MEVLVKTQDKNLPFVLFDSFPTNPQEAINRAKSEGAINAAGDKMRIKFPNSSEPEWWSVDYFRWYVIAHWCKALAGKTVQLDIGNKPHEPPRKVIKGRLLFLGARDRDKTVGVFRYLTLEPHETTVRLPHGGQTVVRHRGCLQLKIKRYKIKQIFELV